MATTERTPAAPSASADNNMDTVARLGAQRRKWKEAAKNLTAERDAEKAKVTDLQKQIDDLKKSGGPEEIAKLKGQLLEQSHKAKFAEMAKQAGCQDPKALEDLWDRSGYKPEGDAPDEAKIKAAIETQRTERAYLFSGGQQQRGDQGNQQPKFDTTIRKPANGRGQGGHDPNTGTQFQATSEQLRDPAWCSANAGALQRMAKEAASLPIARVSDKFAIVS